VEREHVLDLAGENVEAAGDHHVLRPVDDVEEPVLVAWREVAGVQPAVAHRARGLLRLVPVAGHHQRAAAADLADLAHTHLAAVVVHQFHLQAGDRGAAGREAFGVVARVVVAPVAFGMRAPRTGFCTLAGRVESLGA
jgi:hypothetical protein